MNELLVQVYILEGPAQTLDGEWLDPHTGRVYRDPGQTQQLNE